MTGAAMTKLDLGPIGVALDVSADDSYLDAAIEVEKLGYFTIRLVGGQLATLDPIAKIIRATTAIPVAPGIISLDIYSPEAVTAAYADLEATHPGRFVVGLGGPQTPRPLRALNEFLDRLDTGEPPVAADRRILAALGPASSPSPATDAPGRYPSSLIPPIPRRRGASWVRTPHSSSASWSSSTPIPRGHEKPPAGRFDSWLAEVSADTQRTSDGWDSPTTTSPS